MCCCLAKSSSWSLSETRAVAIPLQTPQNLLLIHLPKPETTKTLIAEIDQSFNAAPQTGLFNEEYHGFQSFHNVYAPTYNNSIGFQAPVTWNFNDKKNSWVLKILTWFKEHGRVLDIPLDVIPETYVKFPKPDEEAAGDGGWGDSGSEQKGEQEPEQKGEQEPEQKDEQEEETEAGQDEEEDAEIPEEMERVKEQMLEIKMKKLERQLKQKKGGKKEEEEQKKQEEERKKQEEEQKKQEEEQKKQKEEQKKKEEEEQKQEEEKKGKWAMKVKEEARKAQEGKREVQKEEKKDLAPAEWEDQRTRPLTRRRQLSAGNDIQWQISTPSLY